MMVVAAVALALSAGVLALRPEKHDASPRKVIVVNQSGFPIPRLNLIVLGETIRLGSVPAGATVTGTYPSLRGRFGQYDQFEVTADLADGMQLDAGFGFRATGPDGYPVVLIGPGYGVTTSEGGGAPMGPRP
jgi:hypothetical protein